MKIYIKASVNTSPADADLIFISDNVSLSDADMLPSSTNLSHSVICEYQGEKK